jgi:hypothetical protein
MGTIIYIHHTRSTGVRPIKSTFVEPYELLLVGINLSGPLWGEFAHAQRKKKRLPYPLFFRNLFLMLLYLHASASEGVGVRTRTPLRYSLCPQIRAMRASSRCTVDLDLCRPALTERYHTPHPSLPFRLVTLEPCPFIYYDPLHRSAYNTSSFSPHRPLCHYPSS